MKTGPPFFWDGHQIYEYRDVDRIGNGILILSLFEYDFKFAYCDYSAHLFSTILREGKELKSLFIRKIPLK